MKTNVHALSSKAFGFSDLYRGFAVVGAKVPEALQTPPTTWWLADQHDDRVRCRQGLWFIQPIACSIKPSGQRICANSVGL